MFAETYGVTTMARRLRSGTFLIDLANYYCMKGHI